MGLRSLPSGYTRLAYIESTGTQYIDTGVVANQNSRLVMDMQLTSSTTQHLFGARTALSENSFFIACLTSTTFRADYANQQNTYTVSSTLDRTTIDFNKNVCVIGDSSYSFTAATFSPDVAIALFASNSDGAITVDTNKSSMKLYSCQIYDNGTLVRNFVPCKDPDGNVSLYDFVTKAFFGNSGTGVFIAGDEVFEPVVSVVGATIRPGGDKMTATVKAGSSDGAEVTLAGTINGVDMEWTDQGGTWTAQADKSADGAYSFVLTANGAGFAFTLYYAPPELITDRTQADISRAAKLLQGYAAGTLTDAERTEVLAGLKGRYNASDLNRVESAVAYIADALVSLPDELREYAAERRVDFSPLFDVPYTTGDYTGVTTRGGWTVDAIPTPEEMAAYLENITLLRTAFEAEYPALPGSMEKLTYTGANAIEQSLMMVYDLRVARQSGTEHLIDNTAAAWSYSGEIYANEV